MADWSIIVPGIVTPTVVAGYAYWQQRVQRSHAERQEVRDTLDAAARSIGACLSAAVPNRNALRDGSSPDGAEVQALTAAFFEVEHSTDRLAIRLGLEHDVTRAHRAVALAMREYVLLLRPGGAEAPIRAVDRQLEDVQAARLAFLREAREEAGPRRRRQT